LNPYESPECRGAKKAYPAYEQPRSARAILLRLVLKPFASFVFGFTIAFWIASVPRVSESLRSLTNDGVQLFNRYHRVMFDESMTDFQSLPKVSKS